MFGTFRKYVHSRHEFDKDTDGARDGFGEYNLPNSSLVRQSNFIALQQSGKVQNVIKAMLDKSSFATQQISNPVYIEPNIYSVSVSSSGEITDKILTNKSFEKHVNIFYALPDVGSTTYFQKMCCDGGGKSGISFIVDARELSNVKTEKNLINVIENKYGIERIGQELLAQTTLIVDEFSGNSSEDIRRIINLCNGIDKLIICVKSTILFDAMLRGHSRTDMGFYEFRYWNANKLKEFISKFISAAEIECSNIDSAIRFIVHSFSHTDLPITPFLVGMYLRIFFEGNGSLTSLSFVDLLERMETASFAQGGKQSAVYTKHYYHH